MTISCNLMPSYNQEYVSLINNDPDNISKKNAFRVPNNSGNAERLVWARSPCVIRIRDGNL